MKLSAVEAFMISAGCVGGGGFMAHAAANSVKLILKSNDGCICGTPLLLTSAAAIITFGIQAFEEAKSIQRNRIS
jgi:hypothetical protein